MNIQQPLFNVNTFTSNQVFEFASSSFASPCLLPAGMYWTTSSPDGCLEDMGDDCQNVLYTVTTAFTD